MVIVCRSYDCVENLSFHLDFLDARCVLFAVAVRDCETLDGIVEEPIGHDSLDGVSSLAFLAAK